ncbi:hypothetical protein EYF80_043910 [Liparis tanakae]|uniref:Uncharacterized protein n=1 Tax=Liparis tanakae TaxID=230148 RepID=A0A4Z2FX52_9TELE|nr:hypothetical protein EYF80_043910 [Liparis tanakae]
MTKRKSKKPQEEDTSILLEPHVSQAKSKTNSNTSSSVWLFIVVFTAGASVMGWFCAQQQQSLDQLSETFTTMQKRVATLQRVVETSGPQTDTGVGVERRMFALEEAQKQAQETAEFALATSENLRNFDNYDELMALQEEMDSRLTEIKQVVLSVTTLQAMFGNHSQEFEAVKESVVAALSSGSALAENVAWLAGAVLGASARVDEQAASAEALNAQLDGQASDLSELRESMDLHKDVLHTNNQEMAAIKALIEAKQALRAQALEEMLSSVQMTLDEQYFTSQTLRSSLMTRLQTFHSQLAKASSGSMEANSNEEGPAEEEFISTTAQNAAEVKMEDVEEEDEQQDGDNEGEEEEEATQEEQPLQQEVERGDVEEQGEEEEEEEEITPEEEEEMTPEEEEEMTPQKEEDEDNTVGAGEEEAAEDTVDAHVLDTSLEEEVSKEVGETVVEDSGEFNGEVFMDGDGEVV